MLGRKFFLARTALLCSRTPSFPPGAFMLLYVFLLVIVGVPLFFMELAAGQSIRQGSIGVWKHISPNLAGIGYSSCIVRVLMVFGSGGRGVIFSCNMIPTPPEPTKNKLKAKNVVTSSKNGTVYSFFSLSTRLSTLAHSRAGEGSPRQTHKTLSPCNARTLA